MKSGKVRFVYQFQILRSMRALWRAGFSRRGASAPLHAWRPGRPPQAKCLPHLAAVALIIGGAFLLRAELESWLQHVPAGPALAALFRSVPMPGGAVSIALPPAQSRPALTKLISAAQHDAMLYRLRAQEAEMALDFAAAETDWKSYAQAAADRYGALIELADFYHRRMQPRDEIAALSAAAAAAKDDPLLPATAQRAWVAFERMAAVAGQRKPARIRGGSHLPHVG